MIEIQYPGYVVQDSAGRYFRRGQYGRDEMTDRQASASVFVNYETALLIAERINGGVFTHQPDGKQLSLL